MTGLSEDFEEWLIDEGSRYCSLPLLIDGFCRFLNSRDYAIRRCNLASDTIHPLMAGTRHVWFDEATDPGPINTDVVVFRKQYHLGGALIDEVHFNSGSQQNPQYVVSPFYQVEQDGELYAAIAPCGEAQPFPVFEDLAAIGCTAYFGLRLHSFPGMRQKIGLATARKGGLDPLQVTQLRRCLRLLTLHIDTIIEHDARYTMARVYIGNDPGERVCKGMISAGEMVTIEAAIWFSDLRGFTRMSAGLGPAELLDGLNRYFEAIVPLIYQARGEVLKYVGDAILAIFPVEQFDSRSEACAAALGAARRSLEQLEGMQASGRSAADFQHGIGLNVGAVNYGNIGSRERLDFTVIGPAVNLASRIESTCKEVGRTILCSESFAREVDETMEAAGVFDLKGIPEPVALFSPSA